MTSFPDTRIMGRFRIVAFGILVSIPGCAHDTNTVSKVANDRSLDWFHRVNAAQNREDELKRVIGAWGKGDIIHDQRVVDVICHCYGSHKRGGFYADETFRAIVLGHIREEPRLLRSIWLRERETISDPANIAPLSQFTSDVFGKQRSESEKFYFLLLTASIVDRPEIVTTMHPASVDQAWNRTQEWMEQNAPRYQYDSARREYVLQE